MKLWRYLDDINNRVNNRVEEIEIEDYDTVMQAINNARLEKGKWNRVKNVVAVFSDLLDSTGLSNEKRKTTYSKILEYLSLPFIEIHSKFKAEFFDIKGDGGIALYSGYEAEVRAFLASETYKTFIENKANNYFSKYEIKLVVGIGIEKGDLLVKKVGSRGDGKNFYVWSGNAINNAALISKDLKRIGGQYSSIGVSQEIYNKLNREVIREWVILSCGCPHGKKTNLWSQYFVEGVSSFAYYRIVSDWCETHGEEYLNNVLKTLNIEV